VIFAVLPVKSPSNAKQRLSSWLSVTARRTLARLLYEQTLETLLRAKGIDRVVVATSDEEIAEHARRLGVTVFREQEQVSHSVSADAACLRAQEMGAASVMLVPIDVPLATADDFSELAASAKPGLIVVPSSDGTGTNALVRTPVDAIACCFGPGSFRAHVEQAQSKGIPVEVLRLEGLMFDIDTPEDVADLLARAPHISISDFLRTVCPSK
jgi:2-phospho-L-lactate guanylyltransferase